jgi:hypothetical protein
MTEFQVNDIVERTNIGKLHLIADAHQLDCLLHNKTPMVLVYRPAVGVMGALERSRPAVRTWLEHGLHVCVDNGSVLVDHNEQRCYDRLSSGTLHPESALRLLQKRSNYGREFTRNVYSMSPAALEHFSRADVQAWMRERVKEKQGVRFYVALSSLFKGATARAAAVDTATVAMSGCAAFSTKNGFWESYPVEAMVDAWNEVACGGCAYADSTGQPLAPITTAKQYQELFGKPAPKGMFEPLTESASMGTVLAVNVLTGYDLDVECQKRFGLCRELGETDDAFRGRFLGILRQPGVFESLSFSGVELPPSPRIRTILPTPVASPNCASCGDVLNERYERVEIVDGQRHHGMCADRIRSLAAEQTPNPQHDPYAEHRRCYDEKQVAMAMREWNPGFVSRFSADVEPVSKAGTFVHPWECDE